MTPDEKATMVRMREAQMTPKMKRIREADQRMEERRRAKEAEEYAKAGAEIKAMLYELMGPPVKKAPEPDIRIEMD